MYFAVEENTQEMKTRLEGHENMIEGAEANIEGLKR